MSDDQKAAPPLKTYRIETINDTFLVVQARNVAMALDGMPVTFIRAVEEVR